MPEYRKKEKPIMTWYAASVIMYTKFKEGEQEKFPLYENVLLIQADSDNEAIEKARRRGLEDEGDSNGTYSYEGRPATLAFAGIRKVIKTQGSEGRPTDGTEITYSEMEVDTKETLLRLVNGEPVVVRYEE
jgi:hypothetical protein